MDKTKPREVGPGVMMDPAVRFGRPVIKGTRVDVATLLGQLAAGASVEEVAKDYGLTTHQMRAALRYAAEVIERKRRDRLVQRRTAPPSISPIDRQPQSAIASSSSVRSMPST